MDHAGTHVGASLSASSALWCVADIMPGVRLSSAPIRWIVLALAAIFGGMGYTAQLKRADIAESERDRLIHAQTRQVSETAALILRQLDQRGRAQSMALLRRISRLSPDLHDDAIQRQLFELVKDHPDILELQASRGGTSWSIQHDQPPPSKGPRDQRPALPLPTRERSWTPPTVPVIQSSLRRVPEGHGETEEASEELIHAIFEIAEGVHASEREAWTLKVIFDATAPLSPLTRSPAHRLGHLAVIQADGTFIWGPSQQYKDDGGGWLELDLNTIRSGCKKWLDEQSPTNRLIPHRVDHHIFAVGGRTPAAFEGMSPALRICVMMPRRGFTHLQ